MDTEKMVFINPALEMVYEWKMKQEDPHKIIIDFEYPADFNPNAINVKLSPEKDCLMVEIKDEEIPVIYGLLTEPVTDFTTQINKKELKFSLELQKDTDTKWKTVIKNRAPNSKIDPHSAYDIFLLYQENPENSPYSEDEISNFLQTSLLQSYIPAMLFGIENLEGDKENEQQLLVLLDIASRIYNNPVANFKYGLFLIQHNQQTAGFTYLSKAARAGIGIALSLMGQMMSPYSGVNFPNKNASQALQMFEAVISKTDEPIALYEAAKIYLNGAEDVKIDEIKAEEYYQRAIVKQPNLPPLKQQVQTESKVFKALTVSAALVAGASLFYGVYKIFKKK